MESYPCGFGFAGVVEGFGEGGAVAGHVRVTVFLADVAHFHVGQFDVRGALCFV